LIALSFGAGCASFSGASGYPSSKAQSPAITPSFLLLTSSNKKTSSIALGTSFHAPSKIDLRRLSFSQISAMVVPQQTLEAAAIKQ
jgi:hypothetical protein